jgi:hypothetical protein
MMRHRPPRMVLGSGLRIPDIAGISSKLSALQGANNRLTIADQATCRVHQMNAVLHFADRLIVEQIATSKTPRLSSSCSIPAESVGWVT